MRLLKSLTLGGILVAALASALGVLSPGEILGDLLGAGQKARDNGFLLWGLALGYALAVVNRVPWLDLPRRGVDWIRSQGYLFVWTACGVAFGAFLVFY